MDCKTLSTTDNKTSSPRVSTRQTTKENELGVKRSKRISLRAQARCSPKSNVPVNKNCDKPQPVKKDIGTTSNPKKRNSLLNDKIKRTTRQTSVSGDQISKKSQILKRQKTDLGKVTKKKGLKITPKKKTVKFEKVNENIIANNNKPELHKFNNLDNISVLRCTDTRPTVDMEQSILELKDKIAKLEQKFEADEEKMKTPPFAIRKQRCNDVKLSLVEKEKELLLRLNLLDVDYHPERVCRLCLLVVNKKGMLTCLVNNPELQSIVQNTIDLKIDTGNGSPTGVCDNCLQNIVEFDGIKRRCHLANMLSKRFTSVNKIMAESRVASSVEITNSISSDQIFQGQTTEKSILKFSQPINDLIIENTFSLKEECEKSDIDITLGKINSEFKTPKKVRFNLKINVRKIKSCKNCKTVFINVWSFKNHLMYCNKKFTCVECDKNFFNFKMYCQHKRYKQSCICDREFRFCAYCKVSFRWKWQLIFHIAQHNHLNNWDKLI